MGQKIKVIHEYTGAPSGYNTIKEGVYDLFDGQLFGLGDYLIANGNAVPATLEDEGKKAVELTPDEIAIASGQKTDPVVADRHDVLDSIEIDNVLRGNPSPNNRQFTALINSRVVADAARAKAADAADGEVKGDLGGVAANAAAANAEAARNAAGDNNEVAAAADAQTQQDLKDAVERAGEQFVADTDTKTARKK